MIAGHWRGSQRPFRAVHLQADEHNRAALELVELSIRTDAPLVFWGAAGTGKTTLMREIDARTSAPATGLARAYHPWLDDENWWTTASEFCADVRDSWSIKFTPDEEPALYLPRGIARRVRRLFLDDLGVERESDVNVEAIVELLTARHAANLPTWITTNFSPDALRERYGERVLSRLREQCVFVPMGGPDRRTTRTPAALRAAAHRASA